MRIMEAVWPITALYFGPLALWAYLRWGRPQGPKWMEEHGEPKGKSFAASVAVGDSHCGAGCTLGDIVGSPSVVFLFGWQLFGFFLFAKYVVNYVLAYVFGIVFQYFSIKPMRGLSVGRGIKEAVKADTLSLTALQVGLYGWMAVIQLVLFPVEELHPNTAAAGGPSGGGRGGRERAVGTDGARKRCRFLGRIRGFFEGGSRLGTIPTIVGLGILLVLVGLAWPSSSTR